MKELKIKVNWQTKLIIYIVELKTLRKGDVKAKHCHKTVK